MSEAALSLPRKATAREIGFFRAFFRFFSELRDAVVQALRSLVMHKLPHRSRSWASPSASPR